MLTAIVMFNYRINIVILLCTPQSFINLDYDSFSFTIVHTFDFFSSEYISSAGYSVIINEKINAALHCR